MSAAHLEFVATIPFGDDQRETARHLLAVAEEHGLDPHHVQFSLGGFRITADLDDVLYDGDPKTSGNRAGKNDTDKE